MPLSCPNCILFCIFIFLQKHPSAPKPVHFFFWEERTQDWKFLPLHSQGSVYYHQECGYHPRVIQIVLCTPGFPHHPLHPSVLYVRSSSDWAPPFPHMKRGLLCFVAEAIESASSTLTLSSEERKQVQWMWLSLRGEGIYILDESNFLLAF